MLTRLIGIEKLKKLTYFSFINYLYLIAAKLKTYLIYRFCFGAIGHKSVIYKPYLIANPKGMTIGKYVLIRKGVRLEIISSDALTPAKIVIGDNVNIEQNVHIICGSRIIIGDNVSIAGNVAIVDVNHPYDDIHDAVKIGSRIQCDGNYVEIGNNVFIGYGAIILPNVKIGKYSVIGANAVVTKDVPEYTISIGNPAKVIKKYCFETNSWEKV